MTSTVPARLPSIYWNRIADPSLREEVGKLDPNGRPPLTAGELATLTPTQRAELDTVLARTPLPQLGHQGVRINLAGRTVSSTGMPALGVGDARRYTDISTTVSTANLVEPLFPQSIVAAGRESFNTRLAELIKNARSFIFMEGYELERRDLVDALIEKARQGVQVVVLFDPLAGAHAGEPKSDLLGVLRQAAGQDPSIVARNTLHVAEYVPTAAKRAHTSAPIMHAKKVIADLPTGSLAEVCGGINFGNSSVLNFDTAFYTEGVSVLDSLNRMLSAYPTKGEDLPFDLSRVPSADVVRRIVEQRASKSGPSVTIEMAGSGKLHVEAPQVYSRTKLRRMARDGEHIVISTKELPKPEVADILEQALDNGSWVQIVEQSTSDTKQAALRSILPRLRGKGAALVRPEAIVREGSYGRLVYRELDRAIAAGESIDVAAFCLTDTGVLDRLVLAKRAGCTVRVLVDDLTIGDEVINRKSIAVLTNAGIEVKIFTSSAAATAAAELGYPAPPVSPLQLASPALPSANNPHRVKLHAKVMILGGTRVLGGSANFTANGFQNNVEDGRLVSSPSVAYAFTKRLFEPLWARCATPTPLETVPDSARCPIAAQVPMDTPISNVVFVVFDTETTGLTPHSDERVLSVAAKAIQINAQGVPTVLETFQAYITPGSDALGRVFHVPAMVVRIHGLSNEKLTELGARRMREILPDFLAFIERQGRHGSVVMAGQNVAFDLRFLDHTMSRKPLGVLPGGAYGRFDAPYVDTMTLSRRMFPAEKKHDLDSMAQRLGLASAARGTHTATEDVELTAASLVKLVQGTQARVLGDLMGSDVIHVDHPVELSVAARGEPCWRLEAPLEGHLFVRVRNSKGKGYGKAERVRAVAVTGLDGTDVQLQLTLGSGANAHQIVGFAKGDALLFRHAGNAFHRLRERGCSTPRPLDLRAGHDPEEATRLPMR